MASDGTIKISTELDNSEAQKTLSKFSSIAKTGVKGISIAVGTVSAALSAAGGYAIKTGIDFESAFAGVKKTVDATDAELEEFRDGIRDMAKEMPQSASQIAEVAEAAGQLGIQNKNLLSFTEVMSNLGVATNMSATEAATSLARLANITQMPQENFDRLGSTIVALGNNLATTESEITEMGLRLAGAGKQVGMSEDQILGLAGALSSVGIEADAGGSSVSTVMTKIQLAVEKGGESLEQFADVAGMSSAEFKQAFEEDAAQALVAFVKGLGTMEERGKSAIGTLDDMEITEIRQRDALLRLASAGDVLAESLDIASSAWEENTALTKEAEQRYETLESRLQILKNNVADLGITFYDSIRDPLKSTVDEGIVYVDRLSDAFGSRGLQGAVSEAGEIFADLAADAASHAPDMVDSAVQFIQSFTSGLYANRGQVISAAGDIAVALGEGLASLLPASVSKPVKEVVKEIGDSFGDGGLHTAVGTVSTAFKNFSTVVGNVAKVTLPPLTKALDLVSSNLDTLVPLVASGVTAFKSYNAIAKTVTTTKKAYVAATKLVNKMDKANALQLVATNGGLTIQQSLIAIRNGQITVTTALTGLWTKAQTALNAAMSSNPIGLLITATAALTAGIGAAILTSDRASDATSRLTEKQKENIEASKEAIKSIEEEAAARQKSINASTAEIDNAEALWRELQKCVDVNGQVKAGYEARAQYITGELANALGTEISLTDGVIQNYGELESSIYDVIAAKKAEAVLDAMKSEYADAMQEQAEKAEALAVAYDNLSSKKAKVSELEAELAAEEAAAVERYSETGQVVKEYSGRYYELHEQLKNVNAELEVQQAEFDKANAAMQDNQKVIADYNMLTEAVMSGSTEQINAALAQIQSGIDTTLATGSAAAIEQANTTASTLSNILQGEANGLYTLQNQTKESLIETMGMALNQVGTGAEEMKQVLESVGTDGAVQMLMAFQNADLAGNLSTEAQSGMQAMIAAMAGMEGELSQESKDALDSFISGFDGLEEESKTVWSQAWYGTLEGLEGFEDLADPATEGVDAFLESLRTALEVHSPSQATKAIFAQVWPGAQEGLEEGQEELNTTGQTVIQSFLSKLSDSSIFETAKGVGAKIMTFFGLGVGSQTENSRAQGKANADAANSGAGSVNPMSTGSKFGAIFGNGIGGLIGVLFNRGKSLSDNANTGAGSVDPTPTGNKFGSRYASGVGSKTGEAKEKGERLADSAESGAGTADGYSLGSDFGAGFNSGIGSWFDRVVETAASLASAAYNTVKSWLDEHSPSRKGRKLGRWFGQGIALGEEDEIKTVEKSSGKLSDAVLGSFDADAIMAQIEKLDVESVMSQIEDAMSDVNFRIADKVTARMEIADRAEALKGEQASMFTDADIDRLAKRIGKYTANGIKGEINKPVFLNLDRVDKQLPKGAVPRI